MARKAKSLDTITVEGKTYHLCDVKSHDKKDVITNTYKIRTVMNKISRGELDMHPLNQRTDNQWNSRQKSKLIVAVINNVPIGNIVTADTTNENGDDVSILVDGLQRLTTIQEFMSDKFKISKSEGVITGKFSEEEDSHKIREDFINIGGIKYSELPDIIKEKIRDYAITFCEYSKSYSPEEIDEVMFSLNNGSPFKPWQKVKTQLGISKIAMIQSIISDTDWESVDGVIIKNGKCKNDANLGCIIRSMMLIDKNNLGKNGLSITAVSKYVSSLNDMKASEFNSLIEETKELFNDFNTIMSTNGAGKLDTFVDISTLPHIIANIKAFKELGTHDISEYINFLVDFVSGGFEFEEEYNFNKFQTVKIDSKMSDHSFYGNNTIEAKQSILTYALSDYFNPDDDLDTLGNEEIDNTSVDDDVDETTTVNEDTDNESTSENIVQSKDGTDDNDDYDELTLDEINTYSSDYPAASSY